MYTDIHIVIHIYIGIYIYRYIHTYVCIHTRYIGIYIHRYTHIYIHTCMHACRYVCMYVCTYVYTFKLWIGRYWPPEIGYSCDFLIIDTGRRNTQEHWERWLDRICNVANFTYKHNIKYTRIRDFTESVYFYICSKYGKISKNIWVLSAFTFSKSTMKMSESK